MINYPEQVDMVEGYLDYCEGVVEVLSLNLPDWVVEVLTNEAARLNMGISRYVNMIIKEKFDEFVQQEINNQARVKEAKGES